MGVLGGSMDILVWKLDVPNEEKWLSFESVRKVDAMICWW